MGRIAAIIGVCATTVAAVFAAVIVIPTWAPPLFSGALFLLLPARAAPTEHPLPTAYEPLHAGHVDLGTGLYIHEDEDLSLPSTPPFVWRRTYLSGDHRSRGFGIGTSHNGDLFLVGDSGGFRWVELILEDGARVHFDRLTPGSSYSNAVFGHNATPTAFYGAMLGWVGSEWAIRLRDGGRMIVHACSPNGPNTCFITERRDADGHTITFSRDETGLVHRIANGRQSLAFEYDDKRRIFRALDDRGHHSGYRYDERGRLIQATSPDVTRSYEYDDADQLTGIRDGERYIENQFDDAGRLTHQVVRRSGRPDYQETFTYVVERDSVIETQSTDSHGNHRRARFNSGHYMLEESWDGPDQAPRRVAFERGPAQEVRILTLRCRKGRRSVYERIAVRSLNPRDIVGDAVERYCD